MRNTGHNSDVKPPYVLIREAISLSGISESTIRREEKAGRFPPIIKLSVRRRGFLRVQFDQWIEGKRSDWDLFASGAA